MNEAWLDHVRWNSEGLVPVITQEASSGNVLMLAWMNRESLRRSAESRYAVYWSRSRQKLWKKGEESGHHQKIKDIRIDCDEDAILLSVEQVSGIACHTGRHSCFFRRLEEATWDVVDPVLKDPNSIY